MVIIVATGIKKLMLALITSRICRLQIHTNSLSRFSVTLWCVFFSHPNNLTMRKAFMVSLTVCTRASVVFSLTTWTSRICLVTYPGMGSSAMIVDKPTNALHPSRKYRNTIHRTIWSGILSNKTRKSRDPTMFDKSVVTRLLILPTRWSGVRDFASSFVDFGDPLPFASFDISEFIAEELLGMLSSWEC